MYFIWNLQRKQKTWPRSPFYRPNFSAVVGVGKAINGIDLLASDRF